MGLFDFLGSSVAPVSVPTFVQGSGRDSTDLQIRSLLYLFKRLRINRLALFPNGNSLKYADGKLWDDVLSGTDMNISKLDGMYNLAAFEMLLLRDQHRVLIDFPKNKFRMLCVLSEYPSANFSRPLSPTKFGAASEEMDGGFPVFKDYKERKVLKFCFSILPVDASLKCKQVASELANSFLYFEHFPYVSLLARYHIARKAIGAVLGTATDDVTISLSEESKAEILFQYLTELAFTVQVIRMYDQYIKMEQRPSSPTKLRSVKSSTTLPQSPTRVIQPTPPNQRPMSPKKSLANLRGPLLTSRPSISNFSANELYNPVASPPSPEKSRASGSGFGEFSTSSLSYSSLYGREVRSEIWEKAQNSIREKLSRELKEIEASR